MNSRRNFLRIAGAGFTGSLLRPFNASATKLTTGKSSLKVGVLLPQSNEYPLYPKAFLNGLRLSLNQQNALKKNKIEIVTEHINYGSPSTTSGKLQQLITENNVHVVTGLVNPEVAIDLSDLVKNAQVPALLANAGENYLVEQLKDNSFLYFNSLNLYQNAYLSGKFAVEKYGKNISVITAFYESGYDTLFAFYKGVEAAGGNVIHTYLKNQNEKNFIDKTIQNLKEEKPDGIYVYLNGKLADEFLVSVYEQKLEVPMLSTSFVLEDSRLVNIGAAAEHVKHFTSWSKTLKNNSNKKFVSDFQKEHKIEPNQLAFLGYETGLIIFDSLVKCKNDFSGSAIASAISNCELDSPRGEISVNKKSGLVKNPVYLCTAKNTGFNLFENRVESKYVPVSEFDPVFATLDNEMRSGWLNPYLFV